MGVLPALSLPPGLVAMGVRPMWGYQPQKPVAMGASRGVASCGADREPREPLALGPDRCVACGSTRTPSHPGMHLPGSPCGSSILPHLWEPLCCCQSRGLLALAVV